MKISNLMQSYILLYIGIFVYSLCNVMNKLASGYTFLSWQFCFFYGLGLLCLIIYAVIWQQVLKYLSLSTAYANRSIVLILSVFWGWLLFNESITWNMFVGAGIILFGVNLVVKSDGL